MKVLAWVPQPFDTSPGQRFRIEQWEPHLRQLGIEIEYSPFAGPELMRAMSSRGNLPAKARGVMKALASRLGEAVQRTRCDLVYVFREGALLGPAMAERLLSWRRIPFVFDFDDAVWVRYVSPLNSYLSYLRFPAKTATFCRLARHVIAGNTFLRDYAQRFNKQVTIVPTTIDTEKYLSLPSRSNTPLVIGWTGSHSSEQYLEVVRPALERLRQRRDFRLVVVGGGRFASPTLDVEHRPWRSDTELKDLSDFDLGIMPLPDSEWERGKCGLKALQYMALGIPTVVSPVGVNRDIVEHDRNGLLATSAEDWERGLERLLVDAESRNRLGAAGRVTVESAFSAAVHAPRVAEIFRRAIA